MHLMLLLIYTMNYLIVLDTSKISICICFRQYLELLAECAEPQPTLTPSPTVNNAVLPSQIRGRSLKAHQISFSSDS